jgi:hypothetical protein
MEAAPGDTRRRGHELARIKEINAACGWRLESGELPDHLAVVLAFSPGDAAAQRLQFPADLRFELLRAALHDRGSAHAAVLHAVAATLASADEARREATSMASAGSPAERLEPDTFDGRMQPRMAVSQRPTVFLMLHRPPKRVTGFAASSLKHRPKQSAAGPRRIIHRTIRPFTPRSPAGW